MATALQVNPSKVFAQHQATIAASLAHRLAVAKAAQNNQLVALLDQEQRQLDRTSNRVLGLSELAANVKRTWHSWLDALDRHTQLSVKRVVGESGMIFWHAYDPQTGKSLYAESSSEVVKWIEDNHLEQ